jgi:hypothetical protein
MTIPYGKRNFKLHVDANSRGAEIVHKVKLEETSAHTQLPPDDSGPGAILSELFLPPDNTSYQVLD